MTTTVTTLRSANALRFTLFSFTTLLCLFYGFFTIVNSQKHIASVGIKSPSGGCSSKNGGIIVYGGALCPSKKPMKPSKALEMGKTLCGQGWAICSHKDKQIQRLSWQKTPIGCFAFRYDEKKKAAGYGTTCHTNLYFDGVLCCAANPNHNLKKKHYLKLNKV